MAERQGDVSGARGHVNQQEVGLVPKHVGQKLLERLVQHWAAPDHRLAFWYEVANADATDTVAFGRNQHLVDHNRLSIGTEHARHAVSVNVGVDDAHRVALGGQGDGQVDRDGALADPALAGTDEQRAGLRTRFAEWHLAAFGVPVGLSLTSGGTGIAVQHHAHGLAFLVGHDRKVERYSGNTGKRHHRGGHPSLDFVAQWAPGNRQLDVHGDAAIGTNVDTLDHSEVDDRPAQFGILDRSKCFDDLLVGDGCCRHGRPFNGGTCRITTTRIGRIPAWLRTRLVHRWLRVPLRQPFRPLPMPLAIQRGAASICSLGITTTVLPLLRSPNSSVFIQMSLATISTNWPPVDISK